MLAITVLLINFRHFHTTMKWLPTEMQPIHLRMNPIRHFGFYAVSTSPNVLNVGTAGLGNKCLMCIVKQSSETKIVVNNFTIK